MEVAVEEEEEEEEVMERERNRGSAQELLVPGQVTVLRRGHHGDTAVAHNQVCSLHFVIISYTQSKL